MLPSAAGMLVAAILGSWIGGILFLAGITMNASSSSYDDGSGTGFIVFGGVVSLAAAIWLVIALRRLAEQIYEIYLTLVRQ